jgi:hypothetical protein
MLQAAGTLASCTKKAMVSQKMIPEQRLSFPGPAMEGKPLHAHTLAVRTFRASASSGTSPERSFCFQRHAMPEMPRVAVVSALYMSAELVSQRTILAQFPLESKACDGGDAAGCTSLGLLYSEGEGVGKDTEKARQLLIKGCSMGDQTGCDQLKNGQATPSLVPKPRGAPQAKYGAQSKGLVQSKMPFQGRVRDAAPAIG